MTKTEHYQLPQWEAGDPIRRGDFNDAFAVLDEEVARKPFVVGSYTGTGAEMTIELGFRPSFVIISGASVSPSADIEYYGAFEVLSAGGNLRGCITFTDTGFTLHTPQTSNYYPQVINSGRVYDYIAFR